MSAGGSVKPDYVSQDTWNISSRIAMTGAVRRLDALAMATEIARAIAAAVAAEREACAVAAEALERGEREWVRDSLWAHIKAGTAAAIRARSTP